MRIHTFADVHNLLEQYVPQARSTRGAYTLERMQRLMDALDNPQEQFKTIHIAGTSGKTSTAYYTAALLTAAGINNGLMVSPYIDEINERVQLNLEPLSEAVFCEAFTDFMTIVNATKLKPTYFELLIAFGYWYLAQQRVQYVVVEVGVGGLLDGTNVIRRADKVCVITDIGLDHTQLLGGTIPAITAQKAGIIQPHNVVVTYEHDEPVMQVIREVTDQKQATLHEIWPLKPRDLPHSLPLFQRRNWYLAWSAYQVLQRRDILPRLDASQLALSAEVYIPARMEEVAVADKLVVLDGAHNAQKIAALADSIKAKYPHKKYAVLLSMLHVKSDMLDESIRPLLALCDHLIITSFETQYAAGKVSINPYKIAEVCDELGFQNWEIVDDPKQAYNMLLNRHEEVLLVTGSFYLLNHIRPEMHISAG